MRLRHRVSAFFAALVAAVAGTAATAAPAQADILNDLLTGTPLGQLLSDRSVKSDVTAVDWSR
ncbi:hypothetical protein [Nocardiopsis trehalosi]|jgi:hypothetical protein|uniref:hypothetical protein n=1 Tax=Nocardiopsis trehalosi TaxID=109329 RepID=UPI0008377CB1|nr:hypothetical protein [Nocardiopsis trehalosi]